MGLKKTSVASCLTAFHNNFVFYSVGELNKIVDIFRIPVLPRSKFRIHPKSVLLPIFFNFWKWIRAFDQSACTQSQVSNSDGTYDILTFTIPRLRWWSSRFSVLRQVSLWWNSAKVTSHETYCLIRVRKSILIQMLVKHFSNRMCSEFNIFLVFSDTHLYTMCVLCALLGRLLHHIWRNSKLDILISFIASL